MNFKNWLDPKSILIILTILCTAYGAWYRLGTVEQGLKGFTIKMASVEADMQSLRLRIIDLENDVENHGTKLDKRESFMIKVEDTLDDHKELLIQHGSALKYQTITLDKILKKLE